MSRRGTRSTATTDVWNSREMIEIRRDWQVVCIQEASPESVRLALDFYSMPGVPTVVVSREQLSSGAMLVRNA